MRELEPILLGPIQQVTAAEPAVGNNDGVAVTGLSGVLVKWYASAARTELTVENQSTYTAFKLPNIHWITAYGKSWCSTTNFNNPSIVNTGGMIVIPYGVTRVAFWEATQIYWYEVWGFARPYIADTNC